MRIPLSLAMLLTMSACGAGEEEMPVAEEPTVAPAPAVITASDFLGTWEGQATLEGTPDPIPVTIEGTASGWTMTLPDRDPIALTTSMSGDSLVLVSEPYESVIQDGVTVHTRSAVALQDGRIVGALTATYMSPDGENVVPGTLEASRTGGGM